MKIGIMSMQRIVNYGSYLQAYGLKKSIEKFNHNVQFIDYHAGKPLSALPSLSKQNILKKIFLKRHKFSLLRLKIFQKKFKNYFNYLGFADNEFNYNTEVDILVIGSDEVFNCCQKNELVGYAPDLFGANSNAKKLISYAASFGNTSIVQLGLFDKTEEVSNWLGRFDTLSVRDLNSYFIVKTLCKNEPFIHIDPVLLYDFENDRHFLWNKKYKKNYLILYAYSFRMSDSECAFIKQYAKRKNLKIITIGGIQKVGKFISCNPFEVLSYFKNADCIVTDTFHGTIFSIITHSNFATIIRQSINGAYGNEEKLKYLLETFKMNNRAVESLKDMEIILQNKPSYIEADEILHCERDIATKYLSETLNIE